MHQIVFAIVENNHKLEKLKNNFQNWNKIRIVSQDQFSSPCTTAAYLSIELAQILQDEQKPVELYFEICPTISIHFSTNYINSIAYLVCNHLKQFSTSKIIFNVYPLIFMANYGHVL